MEPVTDQTRTAVWQVLCDLEWNTRYYGALADRYRFRHRALRFVILIGLLGEAATFYVATMNPWLFWIGAVFGALLVALTVWDALSDYAEDAAILRVTGFICNDLNRETDVLWRRIETYGIAPQDAEARLESITERWARATQRVRPAVDHQLNRQTAADANQEIVNRYANRYAV